MAERLPPDCGHVMCLMEEALHECGKCTEFDQIVLGVYCPQSVCRLNAARATAAPSPAAVAGESAS